MGFTEWCEVIDGLSTLDLGARGQISTLYRVARKTQDDRPLAEIATRFLSDNVASHDNVLITTGWLIPGFEQDTGEPDGVLGTAVLSRALDASLHARSVIVTEEPTINMVQSALRGVGMNPVPLSVLGSAPRSVATMSFPTDWDAAKKEAPLLLDEIRPSAVIAVEKGGANEKGEYHITVGVNTTKGHIKADEIVFEARRRDIPTLGIGDGGNEIGMGLIRDQLLAEWPSLAQCQCSCGGGVLSTTATDRIVVGATSNLACYGIAAALAAAFGTEHAAIDGEIERRMALAAANAGAVDGILGYAAPSCDGIPGRMSNLVSQLMHGLVQRYLHGQDGEDVWELYSQGWPTWMDKVLSRE